MERHASWLELFFDLIFVLVVSQLALLLYGDPSLLGFLRFAALFIPLWWAWVGYTFYASRFEVERDITYRIVMIVGMLAVGALAVNIRGAFSDDGGARAFALSYVAVRLVLIGLYIRVWMHVHLARRLAAHYLAGFGLGSALWTAALFMDAPLRYLFWGTGLLVELATPLFSTRVSARTPYDITHLPERFGLFTIIVLGESILAVVTGVADTHWMPASAIAAAICFGISVTLWWLYFDFVETSPLKQWGRAAQIYTYGHFPIAMSIVMVGVGTHHAIVEAVEHELAGSTRWLLCAGAALYLFSISIIRLATGRTDLIWSRLCFAVASLALAALGGALDPLVLIGLLMLFLAAEVVIETVFAPAVREAPAGAGETESPAGSPTLFRVGMSKGCGHVDQIRDVTPSSDGCEECRKLGETWVQIRICLICGNVGCCETSKNKHAEKHYHATGHPLIESFEPGNKWRWCYIDETYL